MSGARTTLHGRSVAIVGIGCRFPGGVTDAESLWTLLSEGRDAITEIPRTRIDLDRFFDARPAVPGKTVSKWGGFLDGIDEFDAEFFEISPREAERLDPQQRMLLETAWEALEDAGQDVVALNGARVGVFVGQWISDFEGRVFADPEAVDFYMTQGSGRYASSGRISYAFGFRGPSLTIDSACSSSLAAVHLAVQSLRSGESDLCLAGGVNIILQPQISVAYSQSGMMARDGRCKFGDARGDGYVRSEGAGLVALKLLDRALTDGDRVYAVIRGSAVNNDGSSSGSMGRPSRIGQEELLRMAYRDAGIAPSTVSYVEAHGTGTRAGDPVEVSAIARVLGEDRSPSHPIYLGSIKSNIGHCEGAAGVAGLMKTALALQRRMIPPSLHCEEPNPKIDWRDLRCEVVRSTLRWPAVEHPCVAGVSAYGISGTNAHVVLEGIHATPAVANVSVAREFALLPLSARTQRALRALARRYAEWLRATPDLDLAGVCSNTATRRSALGHRAGFAAATLGEMADALDRFAAGEAALGEGTAETKPSIVFVVPGQGAQWVGMARELVASEPEFTAALERCDSAASKYVEWSIMEQLKLDPDSSGYRMDQIDVIQPVLIAMAIAYAEWLKSLGVRPDAVVGHSMGEVGAAYLAGVLNLDQAMRIICRRSALMRSTSGQGAMAMIDLPMSDVENLLAGRESQVSLAVSNSPRSCVISGEPAAVNEVLAECERRGVFSRLVKVDVASHSPQMTGPASALQAELQDFAPSADRLPIVSTVLARPATGREFDAFYWGKNMRQPVRFAESVSLLLEQGATVFVELSPHPILMQAVQETAQAYGRKPVVAIECGRREAPEQLTALAAVARLWTAGVRIDWTRLIDTKAHVQLPLYPWQREKHWVRQAEQRSPARIGTSTEVTIDESQQAWLHALRWRSVDLPDGPAVTDSRLWLVVGSSELAAASCDELRASGLTASHVSREQASQTIKAAAPDGLAAVVLLASSDPAELFAPVEILQACAAAPTNADGSRPAKIWLATVGAQLVEDRTSRVDATQGALWGAGRMLAEEHPNRWGGLVDLDPLADPQRNARSLVRAMLSGTDEDQVAFRGESSYALRLTPLDEDARIAAAAPWRTDGAYLITGGLGAVGLLVAAAMVTRGARRLVLMGRNTLPPRGEWSSILPDTAIGKRIGSVRALEAAGATVHLLRADVADAGDLERALGEYAAEAWPPIVGVIHAAGVMENRFILDMDAATFHRVVRPKLEGARNLDRLFPDVSLFVVFSSIIAAIASPGMVNYAAANAGLDALAADRCARGAHGLSVQWGGWHGTGVHAGDVVERSMDELRRQGIDGFTPAQAVRLFDWLAAFGGASVMVMPVDWQKFCMARAGHRRPLFNERIVATTGGRDAAAEFATAMAAAPTPQHRRQLMENTVRDIAARVLRISVQKLDPRRRLGTIGLDSLMAIELRNRLASLLGRPLSATLTFNYPTIEALAAFLAAELPVAQVSVQPVVPAAVVSAPLGEDMVSIAALSDDDVALALRAGRRGHT